MYSTKSNFGIIPFNIQFTAYAVNSETGIEIFSYNFPRWKEAVGAIKNILSDFKFNF